MPSPEAALLYETCPCFGHSESARSLINSWNQGPSLHHFPYQLSIELSFSGHNCLRHTYYITETLLATHSPIALVPCLSYWDRASFAHDRLSATVSESQSYPGMGKIVLVESKREKATDDVLKQVLALNHGRFEERVEVWDWRVLEDFTEHVLSNTGRKWFLGATIWDEGKGRSVFVWNRN
jgi:hypothetical protein